MRYGIQVVGRSSTELIDAVGEAEALGFDAAWLTSGWLAQDPLPVLAVAARETSRILLGTSIIPMLTRHPLAVAQAAMVVQEVSDGRFRLGIGTSTKGVAERILGVPWPKPLAALTEYLAITRTVLETGRVDFSGAFYSGRGRLPSACPVPIFAAALGARAWETAGSAADGGISWMQPRTYLRSIARPALDRGATAGNHSPSTLVAHVPVALTLDRAAIGAAMAAQLGSYARVPEYQAMFAAAGAPVETDHTYSQRLLDDLVLAPLVASGALDLASLEGQGIDEVLFSVLDTGAGVKETTHRLAEAIRS